MHDYQRQFIEYALQQDALRFGQFTLKSGRMSPYFFNAGSLVTNTASLQVLADSYAAAIAKQFPNNSYDVLFGPAYKGIPLAVATALSLLNKHQHTTEISFNRKEAKDHGEGGMFIGATLTNKRILLIDDVLTAGTAATEAFELIKASGGTPIGMIIAFDRQERGTNSPLAAVQAMQQKHNIPVISICTLANLIEYLREHPKASIASHLDNLLAYHAEYKTQ